MVYGSPCGRPEKVCLFILPWLAIEIHRHKTQDFTSITSGYLYYSSHLLHTLLHPRPQQPRGALHIRVISSTSAQRRIIRPHRTHRATPDDGQSTCPKRRVQVLFFRATQERITTVLFRTKPVLLKANQGRINKQTFSGLPHGEP